jgi:LemA protein
MAAATIVLLVVVGLIVIIILWLIGAYNGLVQLRNQAQNAWSQIDVQLKRRHDLIPNLVETARGYMQHERETLEAVTRARNLAQQASGPAQAAPAERQLSSALGQFFLVVEQYPNLKANENFLALQEELTSTENKISFARQFYNDATMTFRTRLQTFPTNIIAGMFNFKEMEFFQLESEADKAVPQVKF